MLHRELQCLPIPEYADDPRPLQRYQTTLARSYSASQHISGEPRIKREEQLNLFQVRQINFADSLV